MHIYALYNVALLSKKDLLGGSMSELALSCFYNVSDLRLQVFVYRYLR